ncbi:hypothetical protein D0Z00_004545 [Geotrichum galactomycetum]|uniref:Uncharacterized protein n=1 Tax=Geotrichum galactomycetum TaxID=27317 RepID=A0ACB6UY97_9ASCO|nr:hypothetical protein D0Z00_004545 [Geotrichum candidum]
MISSVLRVAARRAPVIARRNISFTAVRRADLIQDLYVKEVKAFKPAAISAADAASSVKSWAAPAAPAAPAVEGDVAAELAEYEAQAVEVESAKPVDASANAEVEDWFVIEEANDLHHH